MLENLGFSAIDERSYQIRPRFADGEREVALHDMVLETDGGAAIELERLDKRLEAAFLAVVRGEADNDGFNRLVIGAGADWREAAVLRAYCAYLRQLGSPFGLRYLADTLARHAGLARDLLELFHLRFDPDRKIGAERPGGGRSARAQARSRARSPACRASTRIASCARSSISSKPPCAPTSTSATRRAGSRRRSPSSSTARRSRPRRSPSPSARSGSTRRASRAFTCALRRSRAAASAGRTGRRISAPRCWAWCAPSSSRTPSSCRRAPRAASCPSSCRAGGGREEIQKEGIAAYRIFISALLDITDNIKDGKVVPPRQVVRHDGDDPYLVVAADKGTATFSDIANEISAAARLLAGRRLRLGRLGRLRPQGAWRSRRAVPGSASSATSARWTSTSSSQPFRVVGVGDMSGDVFGNGMLLSEHIRLVAAFDHRDIFLDPHPGPASFAERKRLFELPRSSWQDYDKAKISKGGGVFSRGAKSIPLSAEIRALLGLDADSLTPNELIRAILKCRDRPAVVRRHRHLPARLVRDRCRGRRPRQRSPCASRRRRCARK